LRRYNEETHLDVLTPPLQPRTLTALCNDQLPLRDVLDRLSNPGRGLHSSTFQLNLNDF
jgi:hypothetical protein